MSNDLEKYISDLTELLGYSQNPKEIIPALLFLKDRDINIVVEIGGSTGFSMMCWPLIADGLCISIDLPQGPFGGQYEHILMERDEMWKEHFGEQVIPIWGDSKNPNTISALKKLLKDEKIDFLFIDGDHTYQGVKRDYELYREFVSENGIIAFHDINPHDNTKHDPNWPVEVDRFWNELEGNKIEFNDHSGDMGIGMILLGEQDEG